MSLKPQDVLVLLKIFLLNRDHYSIREISNATKISISEVHSAIKRCQKSNLINPLNRRVLKAQMSEFIIHGLKYVFPAELGTLSRGLPTAHSAKPLSNLISSENCYVWPYSKGEIRGTSILPLYKSVTEAVQEDQKLYEFLALIDALRIGRARELKIAEKEILKRIKEY